MNQKELKELIEFLIEKDIAEFELERGDVKVRIKRGNEPVASAATPDTRYFTVHSAPSAAPDLGTVPAAPSPVAAPSGSVPEKPLAPEEGLHIVRSPIVGTFYESPSPGSPPFVKPGDMVEAGQILCIVEAMKLMNEIESDVAGEIVKRLVVNNAPIEYGQELFAIRPRS
jgi:acetyl-CoA carboxylase biotin carboxyl carrier protein